MLHVAEIFLWRPSMPPGPCSRSGLTCLTTTYKLHRQTAARGLERANRAFESLEEAGANEGDNLLLPVDFNLASGRRAARADRSVDQGASENSGLSCQTRPRPSSKVHHTLEPLVINDTALRSGRLFVRHECADSLYVRGWRTTKALNRLSCESTSRACSVSVSTSVEPCPLCAARVSRRLLSSLKCARKWWMPSLSLK